MKVGDKYKFIRESEDFNGDYYKKGRVYTITMVRGEFLTTDNNHSEWHLSTFNKYFIPYAFQDYANEILK